MGVDPFNRDALHALKDLKGREEGKPILVVISDAEVAEQFLAVKSPLFKELSARYWPGALTLVGRARGEVPYELTAGTGSVGIRLPDDGAVRALARACGGALTATSANPPGQPPARSAVEVQNYFSHRVALIVDGGESRTEQPSTVLDVTGSSARVIREGVITLLELSDTMREIGAIID
ncbi:MAG: L-threonylcarbamoyladenylate synthase [Acidobacteria bacterium]|nr:L-threonylcarbamoyladenylate synthase [Acidobacteriota bacterium]